MKNSNRIDNQNEIIQQNLDWFDKVSYELSDCTLYKGYYLSIENRKGYYFSRTKKRLNLLTIDNIGIIHLNNVIIDFEKSTTQCITILLDFFDKHTIGIIINTQSQCCSIAINYSTTDIYFGGGMISIAIQEEAFIIIDIHSSSFC